MKLKLVRNNKEKNIVFFTYETRLGTKVTRKVLWGCGDKVHLRDSVSSTLPLDQVRGTEVRWLT